jgi:hypothetical protein
VLRLTRDAQRKDLAVRDICRLAQVNLSALRKGYLKALERERIIVARNTIAKWKQNILEVWALRLLQETFL